MFFKTRFYCFAFAVAFIGSVSAQAQTFQQVPSAQLQKAPQVITEEFTNAYFTVHDNGDDELEVRTADDRLRIRSITNEAGAPSICAACLDGDWAVTANRDRAGILVSLVDEVGGGSNYLGYRMRLISADVAFDVGESMDDEPMRVFIRGAQSFDGPNNQGLVHHHSAVSFVSLPYEPDFPNVRRYRVYFNDTLESDLLAMLGTPDAYLTSLTYEYVYFPGPNGGNVMSMGDQPAYQDAQFVRLDDIAGLAVDESKLETRAASKVDVDGNGRVGIEDVMQVLKELK